METPVFSMAAGEAGAITVPVYSNDGSAFDLASFKYSILDDQDAVIVPAREATGVELVVQVPADLVPADFYGVRIFTVSYTAKDTEGLTVVGDCILSYRSISILQLGVNTFQTFASAFAEAELINSVDVASWRSASRIELERALVGAFNSITALPITDIDGKLILEKLQAAEAISPAIMSTLKRIQVYEASSIASDDGVAIARRNGIISMTVGESSQFYGQSKGTLDSNALLSPIANKMIKSIPGGGLFGGKSSLTIGRA